MSSTWDGSDLLVFTKEQFAAIAGRDFSQGRDAVLIMNADAEANNTFFYAASYWKSGSIWAHAVSGASSVTRINYLIALG